MSARRLRACRQAASLALISSGLYKGPATGSIRMSSFMNSTRTLASMMPSHARRSCLSELASLALAIQVLRACSAPFTCSARMRS